MNGEEDIKKNKRLNGKRVLKAVRSLQKFLSKSSKPRGRPPKVALSYPIPEFFQ